MTFGDFEQMRQAEIRAEAALASLARRGMSRHRGVCWSGLSPEPTPAASDAAIEARARSRHARLVAWPGLRRPGVVEVLRDAPHAEGARAHRGGGGSSDDDDDDDDDLEPREGE